MTLSTEASTSEEASPQLSPVEATKASSAHLRGSLNDELADPTSPFSHDAGTLLKFHGIYAQDDRDQRRARTTAGDALAYSCMVRCSVPGGRLRPEQWFAIDRLADEVSDGSLRLTTRQGVQYHFIHKGDLRPLISSLNRNLVTTYAACGDVVRNVMASAAPDAGRDPERIESLARALANRFRPQSSAYWELWLDGERALSAGPVSDETEPLYGDTYLPRKFKIGIAWAGDNSIDVYSQDAGLILVPGPNGEAGGVLVAGGGLGRTHTDVTTFPRLADPIGWVPDTEIPEAVEAVVKVFRDHGNRTDRHHARLKYLVEDKGVAWLREQVETHLGRPLADPVELPAFGRPRDGLGWHQQYDGRWYLGVPVPTGRLTDANGINRRTAVREALEQFSDEIRLTPHQDLLLCGVAESDKAEVDALMARYGVPQVDQLSLSVVSSMACPALPTCGQALGEAERVLPELTDRLDSLLIDRGLDGLQIETRMTGCPNGCARPYTAEIGIVGRTKTRYDVFIGGDAGGTRLAQAVVESVPFTKLDDVLGPLLDFYKADQAGAEHPQDFGDWADGRGVSSLTALLPSFGR